VAITYYKLVMQGISSYDTFAVNYEHLYFVTA